MLINPKYCFIISEIYHFKTRYIIQESSCVVTLFYDGYNKELMVGSQSIKKNYFNATPEHIKEIVLAFLEDPLVEIDLIRRINKQYKNCKLEIVE